MANQILIKKYGLKKARNVTIALATNGKLLRNGNLLLFLLLYYGEELSWFTGGGQMTSHVGLVLPPQTLNIHLNAKIPLSCFLSIVFWTGASMEIAKKVTLVTEFNSQINQADNLEYI